MTQKPAAQALLPNYSDEQTEAQEEVNCQLMRALTHWNQDLLLLRPTEIKRTAPLLPKGFKAVTS